jgi:glycosyltransferase involved in cell wall biosynthesis
MHPACSHDRLNEYLADKHFYIFPTTEPREGHSNALTEAMAWGLIPVATDIGFNRTVIDDDMLIVKQLSSKSFADIIANIIDNGRIQELSERAYHRIQSNYTEDIVYNRLKEEYNTLFSLCHTTRES